MKTITQLPRCYAFWFEIETMTLFFSIQKWLIPQMQEIFNRETPLMNYMYKTYKGDKTLFADFGKPEKPFGWEHCIVWNEETEDEIVYSYTLSPLLTQTDNVCGKCNGTKIDGSFSFGRACHDCRETGKEYVWNERNFSSALISLYPLLSIANGALNENCIEWKEPDTRRWIPQTSKKQEFVVGYSDTAGMCNCSIQAWIDDTVFEKIKVLSDESAKAIVETMQKVEAFLYVYKKYDSSYRVWFYNDNFGFSVPGNACTLGMSMHGIGMFGRLGKTLFPHNIDTRFQQMAFIVGLGTTARILHERDTLVI